jgi:hypothetical protein
MRISLFDRLERSKTVKKRASRRTLIAALGQKQKGAPFGAIIFAPLALRG